jgi:hypothetical protein
MPESINNTGLLSIIYLKRLSNAALASLPEEAPVAFPVSPVCPALCDRYFWSRENQSQKFERSLSPCASALVSRQSPRDPGRKKRQFLQERRSFPQL